MLLATVDSCLYEISASLELALCLQLEISLMPVPIRCVVAIPENCDWTGLRIQHPSAVSQDPLSHTWALHVQLRSVFSRDRPITSRIAEHCSLNVPGFSAPRFLLCMGNPVHA